MDNKSILQEMTCNNCRENILDCDCFIYGGNIFNHFETLTLDGVRQLRTLDDSDTESISSEEELENMKDEIHGDLGNFEYKDEYILNASHLFMFLNDFENVKRCVNEFNVNINETVLDEKYSILKLLMFHNNDIILRCVKELNLSVN